MVLNPTYTIFKSSKLEFEWNKEKDYRRTIATKDIYAGDLLFIEQGIYDDIKKENNIIVSNLLYNQELWDELYPRNLSYNLEDILNNNNVDNIIDNITAKLNSNIFSHNEEEGIKYTLLRDGCIFNHSKDPNVVYHHISIPNIQDIPYTKIFYFIAYKDIKEGEELCTNYGNDYFKEETDLTEYYNKDSEIFTKNKSKIFTKINAYLETPEYRDVIINHHFFNKGLVFVQSQKKYISLPLFYKTLNKDIKDDITITEMNDWINKEILMILNFLKIKKKII